MTRFTLGTAIPAWALLAIAVALVALAVRTYQRLPVNSPRRTTLVTLRALTLAALVVCLLRPVAIQPLPPAGNVVPVLIDASRSMAIREVGTSRFDRAIALATGPLAAAMNGYHLEFLELRNDVGPLDRARAPSGDRSDLASGLAAVRDRYRGRSVPGIVLLSDGVDTGDADAVGSPDDVPVFPIATGDSAALRDQEVLSVELDPEALPGSSVELNASVVAHGYGRDAIDVRLLASGRAIDMRRVVPPAEGLPVRLTFDLPPSSREPVVYTVDIPARPDEVVVENNSRRALMQPIGRRRRVLFLQGAPGYEHGFLARAWATDPYLDADTVVRKGQNDQGDATFYVQAAGGRAAALASGMPSDRATLFSYDAIVLGNASRDLLGSAQVDALDAFVSQRGGGLLLLGARSFAPAGIGAGPLGAILPVMPGHGSVDAARVAWRSDNPNKLTLTSDGERHAMLKLGSVSEDSERRWSTAPALGGSAPVGPLRPGAQLLAVISSGGTTRPLIAVQRYGQGRSMVFAGEASWRWKMQRPADDHLYEMFWRQAARWLSAPAADPVVVDVDPDVRPDASATLGVVVRDATFAPIRDASVEVVIRDDRGHADVLTARLTDAPRGRYTVPWQPAARGLYHVSAKALRPGNARATGTVPLTGQRDVLSGTADPETTDPRVHNEVLARIAERTGGLVGQVDDLASVTRALRARADALPAVAVRELWHGPWTFAILVSLLAAEWTLRRRWGLR